MKKYVLSALCALALIACAKSDEDMGAVPVTAPETIYATFEEPTTRTYVEQDKYLRWHAEDEISFFSTTYNLQYRFQGKTGDNNGSFTKITTDLVTGNALANNYAVYPYATSTAISDEGVISVTLPATQAYAENSFGHGANTMVAATNGTMDNVLRFKNAGGYLKLQLYGTDVTVKSIALQGNKGEKIAGEATITAAYGNDPVVTMADTATDVVTIDCGEGVTLSNDATTPTIFWFVLPETTFSEGFTVTVTDLEGGTFVKSTSNSFTIDRNMIQPMKSLEAVIEPAEPANNEIWYTSTDGKIVKPYASDVFGVGIISNTYKNGKGVISFDGEIVEIGKSAFHQCASLQTISFPETLTTIGISSFNSCTQLQAIDIPNRVVSIGNGAFYNCTSLSDLTIGANVKTIGANAFAYCESLSNVTIPASVSSIGVAAFQNCHQLISFKGKYASEDGRCLIVGTTLNSFAPYNLTSYTIPSQVRTIGESAFSNCEELTSVSMSDNVTRIDHYAFSRCKGLKKITLSKNIWWMRWSIFYCCENLESIVLPEALTDLGTSNFSGCKKLKEVTILGKITSVPDSTFDGCSSLTTINIPESVTAIEADAFRNCASLEHLSIPNSVTSIGEYAFYGCSTLKDIILPESLTLIDAYSFYGCESFATVSLPASLSTIGNYAFYRCSNLVNVVCNPIIPPTLGTSVFSNNSSARNIYVPSESLEAYRIAANWSSYADRIQAMQ